MYFSCVIMSEVHTLPLVLFEILQIYVYYSECYKINYIIIVKMLAKMHNAIYNMIINHIMQNQLYTIINVYYVQSH